MNALAALVAALSLFWSTSGQAALLPGEGSDADAGLFSVYFNGGISGPGTSDFAGGEGFTDPSASVTHQLGEAAAESIRSVGPIITPAALKAKVVLSGDHDPSGPFGSIQGGTGSATAFTSERFKYIGSSPTTLSVQFTISHTSQFAPLHTFFDYVLAQAAVFSTTDYGYSSSIDTIIFEFGGTLLTSALGDAQHDYFSEEGTGESISDLFTVQFDVDPGQEFYLFQKLSVSAHLESDFADAFSTMTGQFNDPSVVERAVPEPASMLLGVCGAWCLARRRRTSR